jgi:branched-chain amino acid transport system substrate-binding protein
MEVLYICIIIFVYLKTQFPMAGLLKYLCLILMAFSFIFVSCNDDDTDEINRTIRAGVLLPLTGSASSTGESSQAAIEMALIDINDYLEDIHSGCKLELVLADTQSDSLITIQRYTELKQQGVQCIVGPFTSTNVAAVKPLADQDGILIVSPASVASSISLPGDNVFRLVPDMAGQGEAVTALLNDDGIGILVPVVRDDLWGHDLLQSTTQHFTGNRGEVMEAVVYSPSTTDYGPIIASLAAKVEQALAQYPAEKVGVYMLSYNEATEILHLASAVNSLGSVRWYGNTAYAENKTLPADPAAASFARNTHLSNPAFGYDPAARIKWEPLLEELIGELGRKPEIYALAAYDALWLVTLTYLATGEAPDIASLKKAFNSQADTYFGVTGWTTLNANGDRAFSTYDFWGVDWITNDWIWITVARYNNATKELVRY